jgi:hypothetical protein
LVAGEMMIVDDAKPRPFTAGLASHATLDDLFERAAARRPKATALIDPANRESFTDSASRQLSYAEADRMVSAIAGRLRRLGLSSDTVVAMQFANTIESVLTLLAVLRAGMIAMPLPLLWRRADTVAALRRVSASALIVSGRVGRFDQFDLAMQVAAEIFSIRHVCGFGRDPPDGIVAFDDLYAAETLDPLPSDNKPAPARPALITWDMSPEGLIPVARSHAELIAGALPILLEADLQQDATLLSTVMPSSFAGLATSVLPWLMLGGTLALHHPFDGRAFAAQCQATRCDTVIVPGPLLHRFLDERHFGGHKKKSIVGLWRAPERLPRATAWCAADTPVIDVQAFGEIGLIAARRGDDGKPTAIAFGAIAAPHGAKGATIVGEVQSTVRGTVALRGPMVPRSAFPAGTERAALPRLAIAADGFVDTGYPCWSGRDTLAVTGPRPGLASVGGYHLPLRAMEDAVLQVHAGGTLAALPDALCGYRLAGSAVDRAAVATALGELGMQPLLVDAFRDRRRPAA